MLVESPGCILIDRLDIQGVPITPSIDLLMCWNDPQNSGKHFSLVTFPESESESCSVVSDSLRPQGLFSPWNSPGQNTGVGSLSLLQGIFPTQELSWGLLHCRRILYQLCYQGSPLCIQVSCKEYNSRTANGRDDRQGMEKGVWSPLWAHLDVFTTWKL